MDTAPTGKLLLSLSLPIMFSMLMQALYNILKAQNLRKSADSVLVQILALSVFGFPGSAADTGTG